MKRTDEIVINVWVSVRDYSCRTRTLAQAVTRWQQHTDMQNRHVAIIRNKKVTGKVIESLTGCAIHL